jgi:hypothetical protein
MIFLVIVIPHADEADRVDENRRLAGRQWLADQESLGVITEHPRAFRATGGFMLVDAPDRAALAAWLAPYPLRATIDIEVYEDVVDLDEGFDVLKAAIAARPTFADVMAGHGVESLPRRNLP